MLECHLVGLMLEYGLSLGMVLLADFYGYINWYLQAPWSCEYRYVLNDNSPGEDLNRG